MKGPSWIIHAWQIGDTFLQITEALQKKEGSVDRIKENRYVLIDRYSTWKHILYAASDNGAPEFQDCCSPKPEWGWGMRFCVIWAWCTAQPRGLSPSLTLAPQMPSEGSGLACLSPCRGDRSWLCPSLTGTRGGLICQCCLCAGKMRSAASILSNIIDSAFSLWLI